MEPGRLTEDLIALRCRAFELIKQRSFQRRDVVLSSGKRSNYYLDLKPTMLNPEGAGLLCELIFPRLTKDVPVHYVGGLAMGAVPLMSALTVFSFFRGRPMPAFFVRKEVKAHGTRRLVEGVADGELRGKNVVILEDVTTEGTSALAAVNAAREVGANVVSVLTIVDREAGAAELFAREGVSFDALFRASEFLAAT
jgi:orotate phosphoribosyltransferase